MGEETYVKAKYSVLLIYLTVFILIIIGTLLFMASALSFGNSNPLPVLIIIAMVLVVMFLFVWLLLKRKEKELKYVKEVDRETRDKKEIQTDTKFLMGGLVVVLAILIITTIFMPLEDMLGMAVVIGFVALLILGFRKYR